jgi:hypothetical protein
MLFFYEPFLLNILGLMLWAMLEFSPQLMESRKEKH